jgi:hypothetical protein
MKFGSSWIGLFCVVLGAVLAMKFGDYLFPDGVATLGFRVFGAIKGAVGGLVGAVVYTGIKRLLPST